MIYVSLIVVSMARMCIAVSSRHYTTGSKTIELALMCTRKQKKDEREVWRSFMWKKPGPGKIIYWCHVGGPSGSRIAPPRAIVAIAHLFEELLGNCGASSSCTCSCQGIADESIIGGRPSVGSQGLCVYCMCVACEPSSPGAGE